MASGGKIERAFPQVWQKIPLSTQTTRAPFRPRRHAKTQHDAGGGDEMGTTAAAH